MNKVTIVFVVVMVTTSIDLSKFYHINHCVLYMVSLLAIVLDSCIASNDGKHADKLCRFPFESKIDKNFYDFTGISLPRFLGRCTGFLCRTPRYKFPLPSIRLIEQSGN